MSIKKILFIALFILALAGCSTTSKVILLDGAKAETAIVVTTEAGQLTIDKPNTYTVISSATQKPAETKTIDAAELEKEYGKLIELAPKPPKQFLLYFEPGSTTLVKKSQLIFPKIERAIKERAPCDINIIGHADRSGSKKYNIELSLRRAKKVHNWLVKGDVDIENIEVESYGEEDPIIPTADGIAEPRNRRVEVLIR